MDRCLFCRTFFEQLALFVTGITTYGILFLLAQQTYSSAAGIQNYCTLWTDIPGRLSILVMSCYVAGVCGFFALPDSWRLQCFPQPLIWWKLCTWKDQLTNKYRDRYIAMYYELIVAPSYTSPSVDEFLNPHNTPLLGPPFTFSPVYRAGESGYRERESINTETSSYGAIQGIQVPLSNNPVRRAAREDLTSTLVSRDDSGNWTLGRSIDSDVPGHPQMPWRSGELEPRSRLHQETGTRNNFEFPSVKKLKSSPLHSDCCGPSPRRSLRRMRCNTEPSSGDIHELRAQRLARYEQSYSNAAFATDPGKPEGMQFIGDARIEPAMSPDCTQFRMSPDRDLRASTTIERAGDIDEAESDEDERE